MSGKTQIRLKNITKIYQDPKTKKDFNAVDGADITIRPGELVTLLGPSGCGKTTMLRMIAGFESPDEGEIYFDDTAVNAIPPNRRDTAMVFQSYALLPHYNIYNNVAYGLKLRGLPKEEIREKVTGILHLVGLDGMEERMTFQLSGGQQQRVALARALVIEPSVLLFDEPLSNLDAKLRVSMRTEIRRIQQQVGITAVYVTHDQSEAMAISDTIIVMDHGRVMQTDTPEALYFRPANRFVADFIGEANFLRGTVTGRTEDEAEVRVGETTVRVASAIDVREGDACLLVLRPESLSLKETGEMECEVRVSTFMGAYQYYQVVYDGDVLVVTDYNPKRHRRFRAGERAYLSFDPEDLHLIRTP